MLVRKFLFIRSNISHTCCKTQFLRYVCASSTIRKSATRRWRYYLKERDISNELELWAKHKKDQSIFVMSEMLIHKDDWGPLDKKTIH